MVIGQHFYTTGGTGGHYWWGWGNSYRRWFQSTDRTPASALPASRPTLLWNTTPVSGMPVNSTGGAVGQGTLVAAAVAGPGSAPLVLAGNDAYDGATGARLYQYVNRPPPPCPPQCRLVFLTPFPPPPLPPPHTAISSL
jgi:hypothetical protein